MTPKSEDNTVSDVDGYGLKAIRTKAEPFVTLPLFFIEVGLRYEEAKPDDV